MIYTVSASCLVRVVRRVRCSFESDKCKVSRRGTGSCHMLPMTTHLRTPVHLLYSHPHLESPCWHCPRSRLSPGNRGASVTGGLTSSSDCGGILETPCATDHVPSALTTRDRDVATRMMGMYCPIHSSSPDPLSALPVCSSSSDPAPASSGITTEFRKVIWR